LATVDVWRTTTVYASRRSITDLPVRRYDAFNTRARSAERALVLHFSLHWKSRRHSINRSFSGSTNRTGTEYFVPRTHVCVDKRLHMYIMPTGKPDLYYFKAGNVGTYVHSVQKVPLPIPLVSISCFHHNSAKWKRQPMKPPPRDAANNSAKDMYNVNLLHPAMERDPSDNVME
jgi:hypothetical protein